jgi:hypothetical protein
VADAIDLKKEAKTTKYPALEWWNSLGMLLLTPYIILTLLLMVWWEK